MLPTWHVNTVGYFILVNGATVSTQDLQAYPDLTGTLVVLSSIKRAPTELQGMVGLNDAGPSPLRQQEPADVLQIFCVRCLDPLVLDMGGRGLARPEGARRNGKRLDAICCS